MTVIDLDFLNNISNKYNIFKLIKYENGCGRFNLERVLASIFSLEMKNNGKNISSLISDIHQYIYGKIKWGYSFDDYLNDKNNQKFPIVKVW